MNDSNKTNKWKNVEQHQFSSDFHNTHKSGQSPPAVLTMEHTDQNYFVKPVVDSNPFEGVSPVFKITKN